MILETEFFISEQTDPFINLAVEEYLLRHVKEGSCILYLWQNKNTVVIGRNQNAWKECRNEELLRDEGVLARRLSGGGAVYHDLGNLNFTFIMRREDYDIEKQLSVIIEACRLLGIKAEKTGRNDITAGGRKFSGNAFYKTEEGCYHHGTLLIDCDMNKLSQYLNVSAYKLKAKGVASVKSRVINLKEFRSDLTIDMMKLILTEAFENIYGIKPRKLDLSEFNNKEIKERTNFFASEEWRYGSHVPFEAVCSERFDWGEIEICMRIVKGRIEDIKLYSDAMDEAFINELENRLKTKSFGSNSFAEVIEKCPAADELRKSMKKDILSMLTKV